MNHSTSLKCLLAASFFLAPIAIPGAAWADTATALEHYEKAKQAYGAGDFQGAADLLEMAYAEDPDLIYQYNRIRALQAMGQHEEAAKVLKIYKSPMSRDPENRFSDLPKIEAQINEALEKKAKEKPVEKPTQEPDGKSNKTPEEKPVTPPESNTRKIAGWGMVGGGALLIAGGAPFYSGILYSNKNNSCRSNGVLDTTIEGCTREELTTLKKNHTLLGFTMLGAGSALAITGLIVALTAPKSSASSTLIVPDIGPDRAGATLMFRF